MLYKFIVSLKMYHPIKRKIETKQFQCETDADTEVQAIEETKEWYAVELGVSKTEINVTTLIEIG